MAEKSPEIFPKHKGYFIISEFFALNWCIFVVFLFHLESLIKYWASADKVVSSNLCVGSLPKIKIYFFLLSICTDDLISTAKIMTFLPTLPAGKEYSERESNPIPQALYTYLHGSAF